MKNVITYQQAYDTRRNISLCKGHQAAPPVALGCVQHTWHVGRCEACEAEDRAKHEPV